MSAPRAFCFTKVIATVSHLRMVVPCFTAVSASLVLRTMVILLQVLQVSGTESYSMHMVPNAQCPGKVIASGHRYRTVGARSVLECAARCQPDDQCASIVFEKDNSTCHLSNSSATEDCSNTVPAAKGWKYLERVQEILQVQQVQCENGGVLNADEVTCTCPDGYYGDVCDVTVEGCDAVYDRGWMTTSAGVFFVKPATAPAPFPVYCTRLSSGLMRARVAVRKDDTADFNRTWLEYRDGFGEPDSKTHWLGLERLHQFTKDGRYQARFQVKLQNSTTMYMYYENFVIGNESINYAFSVSLPVQERSLGDCLQDLLGAGFSAYDVDNDNAPVNCAQQHGAGWWFKGDNCSTCNPFGPIIPPYTGLRTGVDGEAFWTRNLGNITPLPFIMYLVL